MSARSGVPITKVNLFSFFAALVLSTSLVYANEVEIVDPENSLGKFPFMGGPVEFSKAFQCNIPLPFFIKTGQCKIYCEGPMCDSTCGWEEFIETKFYPQKCSDEQVMLFSTAGHSFTATAADYTASSNSIVRTILKNISNFYENIEKIEVVFVGLGLQRGLIEDGKIRRVTITTVNLKLYPDRSKTDSASLQLHLDLSQSGLHQLMCLSEDGDCRPNQYYLIKRKGLVNATF